MRPDSPISWFMVTSYSATIFLQHNNNNIIVTSRLQATDNNNAIVH